jgi:hypothetical protein
LILAAERLSIAASRDRKAHMQALPTGVVPWVAGPDIGKLHVSMTYVSPQRLMAVSQALWNWLGQDDDAEQRSRPSMAPGETLRCLYYAGMPFCVVVGEATGRIVILSEDRVDGLALELLISVAATKDTLPSTGVD